jgi:ribonucleoside-triphosphate reductase
MYRVVKRDGTIKDFDINKIINAISRAFVAVNKDSNPSIIDFLALKVTAHFQNKINEGTITVENIQDSVETVLIQAGYDDVAKAYILYRR